MFTSKHELERNFGVDPAIAKAFVDRRVPEGNAYWRNRLLYIARGNGYLFMPLVFDLLYRAGVPREQLLDEPFLQAMEVIMDRAARYEYGELSFSEHIAEIEGLLEPLSVQPALYQRLHAFFQQPLLYRLDGIGDENPPLNRADAFLYLFCLLDVPPSKMEELIGYWYALLPAFLLQDDLVDYQADLAKNEENAVQFYGDGSNGVRNSIAELNRRFDLLATVNPVMAASLKSSLDRYLARPDFQYLINH